MSSAGNRWLPAQTTTRWWLSPEAGDLRLRVAGENPKVDLHDDNLLQEALPSRGGESERILLEGDRWWLTLINSNEASTPSGEWMSQETFEWVLLLRGSARIRCENPPEEIDLSVGDYWFIPPHRRHRVERTDPEPGTLWLTLHWRA